MSIFSKIGKVLKKGLKYIAPVAATAAGAYFGAPALGATIGGLFGSKQPEQPSMGDPNQGPQPEQVTVTGQREGTNWGGLINSAMPIATGAMNYIGQKQTNAANAQMAQQQMDFQAQQTGSSWQRGVADMRAAGLNPMLAYSQGGAQSGSGSTAQMGNELGSGANSAMSAMQTMQQMESIDTSMEKTRAETRNIDINTANQAADTGRIKNISEGTKWNYQLGREELNRKQLENYLTNQVMESTINSAKATAEMRGNEATQSKYSLDKGKAYSNYYKDTNKLWGGAYEPSRIAVQEATTSAAKAARDAAGVFKPFN